MLGGMGIDVATAQLATSGEKRMARLAQYRALLHERMHTHRCIHRQRMLICSITYSRRRWRKTRGLLRTLTGIQLIGI